MIEQMIEEIKQTFRRWFMQGNMCLGDLDEIAEKYREQENELLFLGIDLEETTRKFINDNIEKLSISDMTDEQIKAFYYGVNLVLDAIEIVAKLEEGENYVVLTDDVIPTEYTIYELIERAKRKG